MPNAGDAYNSISLPFRIHRYLGLTPYFLHKQPDGKWVLKTSACSYILNVVVIAIVILSNGISVVTTCRHEAKDVKDVFYIYKYIKMLVIACVVFAVFHLKCDELTKVLTTLNEVEIYTHSLTESERFQKDKTNRTTIYITIIRFCLLTATITFDLSAILWKGYWRLELHSLINTYFLCFVTITYSTLYACVMNQCLLKFKFLNSHMDLFLENRIEKIETASTALESQFDASRRQFQRLLDVKMETNNIYQMLLLIKMVESFVNTVWNLYGLVNFFVAIIPFHMRIIAYSHTIVTAGYSSSIAVETS